MKKIFGIISIAMTIASCNKDDNTDHFCNGVESQDWHYIESVLPALADDYTETIWKKNVREFAKTLSEKDCIDTAYTRLDLFETYPQTTDVTVKFRVSPETVITGRLILIVDEISGSITYENASNEKLENIIIY